MMADVLLVVHFPIAAFFTAADLAGAAATLITLGLVPPRRKAG
jgi:hypothetical protein